MESPEAPKQADLAREIDGPFIATFTGRLPFPVVVPDGLNHTFILSSPFTDPQMLEDFPRGPFVTVRFFEQARPGLPLRIPGTHGAIEHFYGGQLNGDPEERWGEESFTERDQWITLETPHAPLVGEDPEGDRGFTFHRCMRMLDLFMQVMLLITKDERMRPISPQDFRPIMIIGAIPKGEPWRHVLDMLMFPDVPPDGTIRAERPFTEQELNEALSSIFSDKPYLTAMLWRTRAQRAYNQLGDGIDAIISFQVAAESLLWDTYKIILVDEGLSEIEVNAQLAADTPFKSLLTKLIPVKLGGTWDITRKGTPVNTYWEDLYLARNRIIHTGARSADAEKAQAAFRLLRDHVEARIIAKRHSYPRTALARFGNPGLERHNVLTGRFKQRIDEILREPQPFFWPSDRAGRQVSQEHPE